MKKFKNLSVGLNLSLVAGFLILFILYSVLIKSSDKEIISQEGGAPESQDTSSTVSSSNPPETSSSNPMVSSSNQPETSSTTASNTQATVSSQESPTTTQSPPEQKTRRVVTCNGDTSILNPQYPPEDTPSQDNKQNMINRQRRLIREYQSYIKNLRGQCCRRLYSGSNLMNNPLSNKNYEVKPMISTTKGNENALYLMSDDFSNIMSISPDDAEKYKVSFYDEQISPPRTYALQASQNFPMYQRTFDRNFVSRIPDAPNQPFVVTPWSDWPGSGANCPASKACRGTFSPPWSTNKAFSCQKDNFNDLVAPEPGIGPNGSVPAPPYQAGQAPPP